MLNKDTDYRPYIESERLYLRNVRISDVNDNYFRWLNDPEIVKYTETRFEVNTKENIRQYVQEMTAAINHIFLAICLKDNDNHIGNIKFSNIDWNHKSAFLNILIGENLMWGKGYASEAITLIVKYGFETLGLNKIGPCCYDVNKGAIKSFENAGFTKEGELKEAAFFENNYISIICLGLTRRDWLKMNYVLKQQSAKEA